jgi:hypothetical protein
MATTITFAGDKDSVNEKTTRSIVRNYSLRTTDSSMDSYLASQEFSDQTGIYLRTVHPTCDFAYVTDIAVEPDLLSQTGDRVFRVSVTYGNNLDTGPSAVPAAGPAAAAVADQQQGVPPAQRSLDPIVRTAGANLTVKSRGSTMKVALYADRNGKAFKNSLGDPLYPPMQRDAPVVVYSFSVNRLIPLEAHYDYIGMVNSLALIFPQRLRSWGVETLKLMDVDIQPVYENGLAFFAHNYTIQSGPYWNYNFTQYLGWVLEVPNVGRRAKVLDAKTGRPYVMPILDGSSVVTEPRYLDSNGFELGEGFEDIEIHWLRFHPDPLFRMDGLWS